MQAAMIRRLIAWPLRASRRCVAMGLMSVAGTAWTPAAMAVPPAAAPVATAAPTGERGIADWLERLQAASRSHNYVGTFVVSSNAGAMSSARVWHACEGERAIDKLETLSGAPRSSFRRNGDLLTLLPDQRLARFERHDMSGLFPQLLKSSEHQIADFYTARHTGVDRVAGFDADVVVLAPRDALRFGYRVWSERRTGLVLKLQTLGPQGEVLEQAAFTELQVDAPLRLDRLAKAMVAPAGWRIERVESVKMPAGADGWTLKSPVPGFRAMSCYKRHARGAQRPMQCVFSDGLASVSLFIEPFDARRHLSEDLMSAGASQTLSRRIDDTWLTAVGEVPPRTLKLFVQGLERRR